MKEIKKGVEAITSINKDSPTFCEFYINPQSRPKNENEESNPHATNIVESYIITPSVLPIFISEGYQ